MKKSNDVKKLISSIREEARLARGMSKSLKQDEAISSWIMAHAFDARAKALEDVIKKAKRMGI